MNRQNSPHGSAHPESFEVRASAAAQHDAAGLRPLDTAGACRGGERRDAGVPEDLVALTA